jgi:hypothetical protein
VNSVDSAMHSALPLGLKVARVFCFAFSIFGCLLLSGCCENEVPSEHLSPDGEWKYVTFDRNCGATTRSNLQVTFLPAAARLPNEAGNTFIADDNHGAAGSIAQLEWLAPHMLQITYSSKARVFKKESRTGIVEIRYVEQP